LRGLPQSELLSRPVWRWPLVVAALLHALMLAWPWLAIDRSDALAPAAVPIPVRLVFEPPAAPPPSAAALGYRQSGPDDRTTAPPETVPSAPEAEEPPRGAASPAPAMEAMVAPPSAKRPERPAAPRHAKPRETESASPAPKPSPSVDVETGDATLRGDPYLNRAGALIERQRVYPAVASALGIAGTAYYYMLIDRSGALRGLTLRYSSGAPVLDEAGAGMIQRAAPFPPLPSAWPSSILITVAIPFAPS
jgi:periplasmic protein TonB